MKRHETIWREVADGIDPVVSYFLVIGFFVAGLIGAGIVLMVS